VLNRYRSLKSSPFRVSDFWLDLAIGDCEDKRPMQPKAQQHRDVENLVPLDHAGDQDGPLKTLQSSSESVGKPTPKNGLQKRPAVASTDQNARKDTDPSHEEIQNESLVRRYLVKISHLQHDCDHRVEPDE